MPDPSPTSFRTRVGRWVREGESIRTAEERINELTADEIINFHERARQYRVERKKLIEVELYLKLRRPGEPLWAYKKRQIGWTDEMIETEHRLREAKKAAQ